VSVRVAFCSRQAAKYAVEHWHYSRVLPSGNLFMVGVWEDDAFVGVVIFSQGATHKLAAQWGLQPPEACELTRIAMREHKVPVSHVVSKALKLLRERNPGLRLVISFADPVQDHHGGVYQAGNWVYTGQSTPSTEFIIRGKQMHMRSVHAKGWKQTLPWIQQNVDPRAQKIKVPGKHRYLMPLDRQMRRKLREAAKPYPEASSR